ncbi:MAG: hypothetical protein ACO1SV_19805 [Fimbriimonas sp.]
MLTALALAWTAPLLEASVVPVRDGMVLATVRNPGSQAVAIWTGPHSWDVEARDAKGRVVASLRQYVEGGTAEDGTLYHAPHLLVYTDDDWIRIEPGSSLSCFVPTYRVGGPVQALPSEGVFRLRGILPTGSRPLPKAWQTLPVVNAFRDAPPNEHERRIARWALAGVTFKPGREALVIREGPHEPIVRQWRGIANQESWEPSPSGRFLRLRRTGRVSVYDVTKGDETVLPLAPNRPTPQTDWGVGDVLHLATSGPNETCRISSHRGPDWKPYAAAMFRDWAEYTAGVHGWTATKVALASPVPDFGTRHDTLMGSFGPGGGRVLPLAESRMTSFLREGRLHVYDWDARRTRSLVTPAGELRFLRKAGPGLVSVTAVRDPDPATGHGVSGTFDLTSAFHPSDSETHVAAVIDVRRRHTVLIPDLTAPVVVQAPPPALERPMPRVGDERLRRAMGEIGISNGDWIAIERLPEAIRLRRLRSTADGSEVEVAETRNIFYPDEVETEPNKDLPRWGDTGHARDLVAVLRKLREFAVPQDHVAVRMVEDREDSLWYVHFIHDGKVSSPLCYGVRANGQAHLVRAMRHGLKGRPIRGL